MARVVKREVSVISKVAMVHVRAKYIHRNGYQPPFSSNSITGLSAMGIGTTSFAAAAKADELVDTSDATVAAAAGGKYLYSPRVKRPSGGINDRTLSRFHFWRLCVYLRLIRYHQYWTLTERKGGMRSPSSLVDLRSS